MSRVSAQAVRQVILASLDSRLAERNLHPEQVPDDFDMLTEGVIDSLGILELIANIEKHFDVKVDFEDLDPEYLTILGPLCRYVEQKAVMDRDASRAGHS